MEQVEPGCVEFLDLTDVEDRERNWILSSLHSWNPNIQLPWIDRKDANEELPLEGYELNHGDNLKYQKPHTNMCVTPPNLIVGSQHPPLYTQIPPYIPQPITIYAQPFPPNFAMSPIQTTFIVGNVVSPHVYINNKMEIPQGFANEMHLGNNDNGIDMEEGSDLNNDDLPEDIIVNEVATENGEASEDVHNNMSPPAPTSKSWASLFNKPRTNEIIKIAPEDGASKDKKERLVNRGGQGLNIDKQPRNILPVLKEPFQSNADDPNLHRMGEFLMAYTVDNRITSLKPRGLLNRSNYCYINSILQAVLACPPLYNLINGLAENVTPSTERKKITPTIDNMAKFVKEFQHLPAGMRVGRRLDKNQKKEANCMISCDPPFEPYWIYKLLSGVRSDTFLVEGRQEDAEEFLGCLLNGLNDEMLELIKLVGGNRLEIETKQDSCAPDDGDKEWQVMGPRNKGGITRRTEFSRTPISDIFGGLIRSRLYRAGDQYTDNIQPFFTLQLNIEKTHTVTEALETLTCKNQLEGVTSSKTNEEVEAWQQVTLEELPIVLALHLKCFDYKLDGCSKIMKALEFPIDLKIDGKFLSPKMNYTAKEKQYKLFAVVYHEGKEATKGHYVTDAYHVGYASWLRYDDASVKSIPEEYVLNPLGTRVPYLLFYRRSDALSKNK